jgi:hypothetical protein
VQTRVVEAPAAEVWDQLLGVTMAALPLGRALTEVRYLPARLARKQRPPLAPLTFLDETPIPVLYSNPPRSVLSAGLSRAWEVTGGPAAPLLDAAALREWTEPGWITVGMEFRLEPGSLAGRRPATKISCETRIRATDEKTRRRFGGYWFLIRAGSVAIRSEVLRVVARRAESAGKK